MLPITGKVGGPGGRPDSLEPIFRNAFSTNTPTSARHVYASTDKLNSAMTRAKGREVRIVYLLV